MEDDPPGDSRLTKQDDLPTSSHNTEHIEHRLTVLDLPGFRHSVRRYSRDPRFMPSGRAKTDYDPHY
jgi:hypothetical protein